MPELTYGQKAVGLDFNPSNNPDVQAIKEAFADAIDLCNTAFNAPLQDGINNNERNRMLAEAITCAQAAQMWAVKGITWKY